MSQEAAERTGSHNITVLRVSQGRGNAAKVRATNEPIKRGDGPVGRGHKKNRRTPDIVFQSEFAYTDYYIIMCLS